MIRTPRKLVLLAAAVSAVVMAAGTASVAQAFPNRTNPCTGCHSLNTGVVVSPVQTSNDGASAVYSIGVSNPYGDGVTGWAVFDGFVNIRNGNGAGTFSVPVGKTYTVYGVAGSGGRGANSVSISPVAPPPPPPPVDTVPPVVGITSPAAGATVSGSVALAATASDAMSGVARVEFRVDGTLVGSDLTAPYAGVWNSSGAAPGSHTIQATAFDNAGLSSATSILVSIASPPPPPPPPVAQTSALTVSVSNQAAVPVAGAKVVVRNTLTGKRYSGVTSSNGSVSFAELPYGDYKVTASSRGYRRSNTSVAADAPTESVTVVLGGSTKTARTSGRHLRRSLKAFERHTHERYDD